MTEELEFSSHPVTKKMKKKTPIHTNCVRRNQLKKKSKKLWILKKGSNFILCENINKTKNILLQTEAIMYAEIKNDAIFYHNFVS